MGSTKATAADLCVGAIVVEAEAWTRLAKYDWPARVTHISTRRGKYRVSFDNGRRHEWAPDLKVVIAW